MHEVVVREKPKKTVYIRRSPDRSFDASSYYRRLNMLQFAKIAHSQYGKTYEDVISAIEQNMKPVGRTVKKRVIEVTPEELVVLKLKMLKKGISRIHLPDNIEVKIVAPPKKIEIAKKLEKMVFA